MLSQEIAESLGRIGGKADVFVHVEGVYPPPLNALICHEGGQNLVLRGCGGKDHVDLVTVGKKFLYLCGNIRRGGRAHLGAVGININAELIYGV